MLLVLFPEAWNKNWVSKDFWASGFMFNFSSDSILSWMFGVCSVVCYMLPPSVKGRKHDFCGSRSELGTTRVLPDKSYMPSYMPGILCLATYPPWKLMNIEHPLKMDGWFTSWWFQPNWKILVKMGIFPNFRGENSKNIFETTTQLYACPYNKGINSSTVNPGGSYNPYKDPSS